MPRSMAENEELHKSLTAVIVFQIVLKNASTGVNAIKRIS